MSRRRGWDIRAQIDEHVKMHDGAWRLLKGEARLYSLTQAGKVQMISALQLEPIRLLTLNFPRTHWFLACNLYQGDQRNSRGNLV